MSKSRYAVAAEELRDNTEQWSAYESDGNCVVPGFESRGSYRFPSLSHKLGTGPHSLAKERRCSSQGRSFALW